MGGGRREYRFYTQKKIAPSWVIAFYFGMLESEVHLFDLLVVLSDIFHFFSTIDDG